MQNYLKSFYLLPLKLHRDPGKVPYPPMVGSRSLTHRELGAEEMPSAKMGQEDQSITSVAPGKENTIHFRPMLLRLLPDLVDPGSPRRFSIRTDLG